METAETSSRHISPCGDPVHTAGSDDTNTYGSANYNYPVLTEFQEGSEFQVRVVVSTYHWGHIELSLCDATGMEDAEVTHECLSQYPLTRAPAEMEPPIDPLHPGRYFLDPPCRAAETNQSFDTGGAEGGDIVTMTFNLPKDLTCERCVLQMMYYVSNACVHPGYISRICPSLGRMAVGMRADKRRLGQQGHGRVRGRRNKLRRGVCVLFRHIDCFKGWRSRE